MGIRTLKPTSPARRYMTLLTNEEIPSQEIVLPARLP